METLAPGGCKTAPASWRTNYGWLPRVIILLREYSVRIFYGDSRAKGVYSCVKSLVVAGAGRALLSFTVAECDHVDKHPQQNRAAL